MDIENLLREILIFMLIKEDGKKDEYETLIDLSNLSKPDIIIKLWKIKNY